MANTLLMPKATAVWLIDNTSLSFQQIAEFCTLHPLEVQAIADGDAAHGIKGLDPIMNGQLTREEIKKGEADPIYKLKFPDSKMYIPETKKGSRYTPLSKRHDKPNAILWIIRNHPDLNNSAIARLIGTTKPTIDQIRDRKHWNIANLKPMDPVFLGICSQIELDKEIQNAKSNKPKEHARDEKLLPASFTEHLIKKNPTLLNDDVEEKDNPFTY